MTVTNFNRPIAEIDADLRAMPAAPITPRWSRGDTRYHARRLADATLGDTIRADRTPAAVALPIIDTDKLTVATYRGGRITLGALRRAATEGR